MRTIAPAAILALTAVTVALAQTQRLRTDETIAKLNLSATELKQVISGVEAAAFDSPDSWEKELRGRRLSLGAAPGLVLQGTDDMEVNEKLNLLYESIQAAKTAFAVEFLGSILPNLPKI